MKYKVSAFLVIIGLLLSPLLVFSQAKDEVKSVKEEEIRRHIETFRMWEMTKALDLTEEQVASIFPALNRIEKERAKLNKQIGLEIRELKELLDLENPNIEQIQAKLEKIKTLKEQIQVKNEEIEKLLEDNLTVEQQAKYIIFTLRFMRDLREKMDRARLLRKKKMLQKREK